MPLTEKRQFNLIILHASANGACLVFSPISPLPSNVIPGHPLYYTLYTTDPTVVPAHAMAM